MDALPALDGAARALLDALAPMRPPALDAGAAPVALDTVLPGRSPLSASEGQATLATLAASVLARETVRAAPPSSQPPRGLPEARPESTLPASPPLADSAVLPVAVTALQPLPAQLQRHAAVPTEERRARGLPPADRHADDAPADDAGDPAAEPEPEEALAAPAAEDAFAQWRAALHAAGADTALRELQLQRRVLLIVPPEPAAGRLPPAQVRLLAPGRVHAFRGPWWPGARPAAPWTAWRLHREGAGAQPLLRSRRSASPGSVMLELRLGPQRPAWRDAASASLGLADVQRFVHLLGTQWSVLALLCPAHFHPA